jgi:hypothetical protein
VSYRNPRVHGVLAAHKVSLMPFSFDVAITRNIKVDALLPSQESLDKYTFVETDTCIWGSVLLMTYHYRKSSRYKSCVSQNTEHYAREIWPISGPACSSR